MGRYLRYIPYIHVDERRPRSTVTLPRIRIRTKFPPCFTTAHVQLVTTGSEKLRVGLKVLANVLKAAINADLIANTGALGWQGAMTHRLEVGAGLGKKIIFSWVEEYRDAFGIICPSESYNRRAFSSHVTIDEPSRGGIWYVRGVHCAATRKTYGGAAPEPCYCPKCACVEYSDEVAVRSEQAIVPFRRSSYALDPQSMEETSE